MSLDYVRCSSEALFVIGGHAMSTEGEEVMGLLLGKFERNVNGIAIAANIFEALPLCRSDKRPDRVEVEGSQLAVASEEAEASGLSVVGWYHSHPHITAAPSHVDAQTQGQYQALDSGFVGLICAAFQGDRHDLTPSLKVIAFQSSDATNEPGGIFSSSQPPSYDDLMQSTTKPRLWRAREMPLLPLDAAVHGQTSSSTSLQALAKLQDALFQEENNSFSYATQSSSFSPLSRAFNHAVYQQGLALLTTDSLIPLLHVAAAKLVAARKRLADLKAKRDSLLLPRE